MVREWSLALLPDILAPADHDQPERPHPKHESGEAGTCWFSVSIGRGTLQQKMLTARLKPITQNQVRRKIPGSSH
jgi:hypothetical protein